MTALSSMLVPLETLPGWPSVTDPTLLEELGLFIGLPLVVFIAVAAIAKIGNLRKAAHGDQNAVTDPVWVGGPTRPDIEGPAHDQAQLDADEVADKPGTEVGGAGARW